MRLFIGFALSVIWFYSNQAFAAKTYISTQEVLILEQPNGLQVESWPERTIFTAKDYDDFWLEISGTFPEGVWQPLKPHLFVAKSQFVVERATYQAVGGNTIVYQTFKNKGSKAKTYKLLEETRSFLIPPTDENFVIDEAPFELWPAEKVFTSAYENAEYIKATGHVLDGKWQALGEPRWLLKPAKVQNRTKPKQFERQANSIRVAVIDKQDFHLTLYSVLDGKKTKLLRTPVALGYDRCLSEAKGGKCYYTPEGQFDIEFKLFDPDGIKWCVPPKMEAEFKDKIAKGERCWRGIMGRHALHFGNSLFLHGTSNPNSIGSKSTHGCVRLRNTDIETVYKLMVKGDKVIVSSNPEEIDFSSLSPVSLESETEESNVQVKSDDMVESEETLN